MSADPRWTLVLRAACDADGLLAGPKPETQAQVVALRGRFLLLVGQLREGLQAVASPEVADAWLEALVFAWDERLLGWLPPGAPRWPLLQRDWPGVDTGGERFYTRLYAVLDAAEREPDGPDPETRELGRIYAWCLRDGFQGRYYDQPERIEALRVRLERVVALPPLSPDLAEPAPAQPWRPARQHPRLLLAGAVGLVILLPFLLVQLSNL